MSASIACDGQDRTVNVGHQPQRDRVHARCRLHAMLGHPFDQLARRFAKSALTAGTSLTGTFITVLVVDRYAASSSATASMSDCAS